MTPAPAMNRQDWTILLALSVIWGGSFFFIEVALGSFGPLSLVLVRVTMAAAFLWIFHGVRHWRSGMTPSPRWGGPGWGEHPRPTERMEAFTPSLTLPHQGGGNKSLSRLPAGAISALLVLALLNNVIPFILFAEAQRAITGGLGSILNATTPIWGVIVAHVLTADEKATPGKVVGVALGFAGVAVTMGVGSLDGIGGSAVAQLECLVATFCYALAGVYARRFKAMGVPPVAVATGQLTAAALVMLPLVLLFEPPWRAAMPTPQAWAALAGLALVCTSFAYILYFRLLASAGATNSLLVTFLIPISAILLGALLLGEGLELRQFTGMALIGLGLVAIDGRLLRRRRPLLAAQAGGR